MQGLRGAGLSAAWSGQVLRRLDWRHYREWRRRMRVEEARETREANVVTRQYTGDPRMDAIIARELRYGATRWAEVWLASIMVAIGYGLLKEGNTFDLPSWRYIAQYVDEDWCGWISLIAGTARLVALYVNGSRRRSPIVRIVGAVGGYLFFGALALGFWLTPGPTILGSYIFGILSVAELHATGRAARDAFAYDAFGSRARARAKKNARNSRKLV